MWKMRQNIDIHTWSPAWIHVKSNIRWAGEMQAGGDVYIWAFSARGFGTLLSLSCPVNTSHKSERQSTGHHLVLAFDNLLFLLSEKSRPASARSVTRAPLFFFLPRDSLFDTARNSLQSSLRRLCLSHGELYQVRDCVYSISRPETWWNDRGNKVVSLLKLYVKKISLF